MRRESGQVLTRSSSYNSEKNLAAMLSGVSGIFFGIFGLILIVLLGGAVTLLLRTIASLGGSISRLLGEFGFEEFGQYSGWCLTPVALWAIGNAVISLFDIGIL